jgi:NADPH-dependent ferric siderophore reductase
MSEPVPAAGAVAINDPFAQLAGPLAGTTRMQLEVVRNDLLTPHMQRLLLTAPELAEFSYRPGQDMMLMVAVEGDRPVRRRYTIRALDQSRRVLTLDVVRHGDGPGERWVHSARPGDRIEGIGPRGKIFPAEGADWHLFAGDESSLPAVFAMAGALPRGTQAVTILEVPEPADEQKLSAAPHVSLRWLPRDGARAGDPAALAAALSSVPWPAGRGHAYLFGEAKVVLRLREVAAERGLASDQVSAKAYWGRGRANASHGEPARDDA